MSGKLVPFKEQAAVGNPAFWQCQLHSSLLHRRQPYANLLQASQGYRLGLAQTIKKRGRWLRRPKRKSHQQEPAKRDRRVSGAGGIGNDPAEERLLVSLGKLQAASISFETVEDVPKGGVLCAK